MSTNEMRCSNCGTTNPPGQDNCVNCHAPLTASAEGALRTQQEIVDDGAVMGGRNEVTVMGTGIPATTPGDPDPHDTVSPIVPPRPA
jgi:hypothetical protein